MFVCKSISLANYLILNNSKLIKIDKNKTNEKYLVFLFEKDDLLEKNLHRWRNN